MTGTQPGESGAYPFEEAAIGALMAMAFADGKLAQEEVDWWKFIQNRHPLFAEIPAAIFNPMLRRVRDQLSTDNWGELLKKWAGQIPAEHRLTLFELATELAIVDYRFDKKEIEVLAFLGASMNIPVETAQAVISAKIDALR